MEYKCFVLQSSENMLSFKVGASCNQYVKSVLRLCTNNLL